MRNASRALLAWSGVCAALLAAASAIAYRTTPRGTLGDGPADVLVVFGSPVDFTGRPMPMQIWRVDEAVAEYRRGKAPYLLFTGGAAANRFIEADTMAREALHRGVPAGAILTETRSTTTLENIRNVTPILKEHGWTRVEMISSPDHLPRIAVLLGDAPFQWRLHAAPTPGQPCLATVRAYAQESAVVLILRIFGTAAEPVIHAVATLTGWIGYAIRWVVYFVESLVR